MQEIKIPHHGRRIDGIVYRPEGDGRFPVVIFSHGFNGHQSDFGHITQLLADSGIGSVCFNFCGGGLRDTSGFSTTKMSLLTERDDLFAVLDEVRYWDWVDADHIYLFGASQGGMVSALVAEKREEQIKAMMLLYPAFCIADDWQKRFPTKEDVPEQIVLWDVPLGRTYFDAVRNFRIDEQTGKFTRPVLIMHGTEDGVVPIAYSEQAVGRYSDARLEVFPGEGHGFTPDGDKRVAEMVLVFVREQEES